MTLSLSSDIGPAVVTTDPLYFSRTLNNVYVQGGGDCPEMTIGGQLRRGLAKNSYALETIYKHKNNIKMNTRNDMPSYILT